MATEFELINVNVMKREIKIYDSFEEQEKDEINFLASLSLEERLNLFFKILNLSSQMKQPQINTHHKIEMILDFGDENVINFFKALQNRKVEYMLIGGWAVNYLKL